jgi:replicative DNA helicase
MMPDTEFDQPLLISMPPSSVQTEEALLGSFLIDPELLRTVVVDPNDFYSHRNRWIYLAMLELEQSGSPVDFATVAEALTHDGKLNEVGGQSYLMTVISSTPSALNAQSYAEIIKDRSQRRRLLQIASNLAKSAYCLDENIDKTISQTAVDLTSSYRPKGGAQHASVYASRHYDRVTELASGDRTIQRVQTGFIDFDRCLGGGLRVPEMLLLLGRPGLGKTKFILQLGFQMGQHMPGAIYEMETDENQIMDRELSRRTKIPDLHFETGKLENEEWSDYTAAISALADPKQTQVYLDFNIGWTTTSLRADLARLKAEYNIQWYMVDYMKFLRDGYGKDEIERLNHISGRLKQINRELDLASVIIHSMNKEGLKSQRPDLSNMSQGADIAFDTDKALFMMPHVPGNGATAIENYRTFVFQKSRSRVADVVFHLQAVKEFPAFLDVAPSDLIAQEPAQKKPAYKQKPIYPDPDWTDNDNKDLDL